jgi:hypothetical protein
MTDRIFGIFEDSFSGALDLAENHIQQEDSMSGLIQNLLTALDYLVSHVSFVLVCDER